ncbi:DUF998 domain-containing protein [Shewanella sp. Isolate11]|uniref:DUF998 domain-containing protein n=1 Tax=Shewanella sp. Isolate11 TaxID=2908530 RepID=UPI001EFDE99E|nr:DUF998 domain-containing protein [Shewanella sp. Isolate11]MCG9696044.1 DUF998 domain-containing protein [Shewanella sp. Isolate11]
MTSGNHQGIMTSRERKLSKLAFRFGLLGLVGHLIGLVIAYLAFSDFNQQGFSFLNFSLSELGQYGHSQLAVVFNGGLFFGSLSLVLFCLFSLQNSDNPWLYPCLILAVIALLGLAITGLFPINVYHLHKFGVEYFFHFAALSVASYLIYLVQKTKQPKRFANKGSLILCLANVMVFGLFIVLAHVDMGLVAEGRWFYHDMTMVEPRPDLWWPALLEWLSLLMFMLWVFSLVWSQREARRD